MRSAEALLTLVAVLAFAAIAGWGLFGSYGDCWSDDGCAPGQRCVRLRMGGYAEWWKRGRTYRACIIPCKGDEDCSGKLTCHMVEPGPVVSYCTDEFQ